MFHDLQLHECLIVCQGQVFNEFKQLIYTQNLAQRLFLFNNVNILLHSFYYYWKKNF